MPDQTRSLLTVPALALAGTALLASGVALAPRLQSTTNSIAPTQRVAAQPLVPKLGWLDASPAVASARVVGAGGSVTVVALVKNEGSDTAKVRLTGLLRGRDARPVQGLQVSYAETAVPPGGTSTVPVQISWDSAAWPITGVLALSDAKALGAPLTTWSLTFNRAPDDWSGNVLWIALAAAVVVVLVAFIALRRSPLPGGSPPVSATWDYSKSWASNVGVAGAVIQLFVAAIATLDQPVHMSKAGYSLTGVLLAAIVLLAPAVYNMLAGTTGTRRRFAFLLACLLTIWGAFGQLAELCLVIDEFGAAGVLSVGAVHQFCGVLVGAAIFIASYAISTAASLEQSTVRPSTSQVTAAGLRQLTTVEETRWAVL